MPETSNKQAKLRIKLKFLAAAAISALLLLLALALFEVITNERHHQNQINDVTAELTEIRASLEYTINSNLSLTHGLATYISLNPDIDQSEFSRFTQQLLSSENQVRHIAAAKDLVITHIYPLSGNEKALGLDYKKVPEQFEAAKRAIELNRTVLAGPVDLVQGETAFIARTPITNAKTNNKWGLLAVVLHYSELLQAGAVTEQTNLNLAIRGKNSTGAEGDFFYGDSEIVSQEPISVLISLPQGSWQLLATPKAGWQDLHVQTPVWFGALLLFCLWLLILRHRYITELLYLDSIQNLFQSERKFRNIFHNHNAVMLLLDKSTGQIVDANTAALDYYGYSHAQLVSKRVQDINIMSPEEVAKEMSNAASRNKNYFTFQHQLASGEIRYVEVHSTPIEDAGKTMLFSIIHDITERVENEQKLKLNAKVFEHSQEGVLVTDGQNQIITVNPAFTEITGYCQEDVAGLSPSVLKSGRHDAQFYQDMYQAIEQQGFWKGEVWNRKKDGTIYPQLLSISKVENEQGNISHYVAVFSDITRLKQSEARMEQLAHYDALTGLPNRLLLKSRIEHALERAKRHPEDKVAILFMDLDHFKVVNDSLGHMVGDELLRQVASRLKCLLREEDTVARLGGDEFVVLLEGLSQISALNTIAQNIIEEVKKPYLLDGNQETTIGTSIGISVFPDDANDLEKLLTYADSAMYKAKQNGRNTYAFYTESITVQADKRFKLSNQLSKAIERQELELFYQPQVGMRSNTIVGAEALIRWNHPEDGLLTPWAFIEIAEETGLIHEISKWVIAQGCRQLKQWQDEGHDLTLALNISPRDFRFDNFFEEVESNVKSSGVRPERLELELTENGLMETSGNVMELLHRLKQLGISLAVDDFGTGHSSIAYLKHFPVDKLKIDRSFIKDIDLDPADKMITETIIDMAKNFNLKVVAEGVETQQQLELLRDIHCDIVQGFYFSKPVPLHQFNALLSEPLTTA